MVVVFIISILVSVIPSVLVYRWIKNKGDKGYQELCRFSIKKGMISILPVTLVSAGFAIIGIIGKLLIPNINPILYKAYYNIIALAFSEELVKFLYFKKVLKETSYKYSWFDVVVVMTLVGLGFGCIENIVFSINSGIIPMLIKGISISHAGYGFIMGWFYGKKLKTNKNIYGVLGFVIPWLIHGLFDFGLSPELIKLNDNFAFISIILELVSIVIVFLIIRFVRKKKDVPIYKKKLKKVK